MPPLRESRATRMATCMVADHRALLLAPPTRPAPPGWMPAGRGYPNSGRRATAFGDEATIEAGRRYLADYYAFTGHFVERIVEEMLTTPQAVAQFARGYADAGCDELVLFPAVAEIGQLERLAEIVANLESASTSQRNRS